MNVFIALKGSHFSVFYFPSSPYQLINNLYVFYILFRHFLMYVNATSTCLITSTCTFHIYTRQQNKRIFLLSGFTSLTVMSFYILLSKQMCICIAIGFAAFPCHNPISRKNMLIFVKKGQNHKLVAHCVKNQIFNAILLHVSSA